jgi:hypothetical protein
MQKHIKWILILAGLALVLFAAHRVNLIGWVRAMHGGPTSA